MTTETIPDMVRDSLAAVRFAAAKVEWRGGRAFQLIAMPILGVGQGKSPGRSTGRFDAYFLTEVDTSLNTVTPLLGFE